ncbi:HNH endonuclease [Georgenia yuyongxinii]|uniref:HNH endonuclease n=1 Tax=Georgenia yuyongxinii TaxID=2589797 RepID=A0A552WUL8_9MICO|nr:HNH endonuclease signature motif containing protein [Georgenia yuyongxinii]TRW46385.1 HNH endonuclease [Georgenia yuyongxinii]
MIDVYALPRPVVSVSHLMVGTKVELSVSVSGDVAREFADEIECRSTFIALLEEITTLSLQRRYSAAMKLMSSAVHVSPSTSTLESAAFALSIWEDESGEFPKELVRLADEKLGLLASRYDPDIGWRSERVYRSIHQDWAQELGLKPIDALKVYWRMDDAWFEALEAAHASPTGVPREQRLREELTRERRAAANAMRESLDISADATALEESVELQAGSFHPATDQDLESVRLQVEELRAEAERFAAAAREHRARATAISEALSILRSGVSDDEVAPTPRNWIPLTIQEEVHRRDGGRCVKCSDTFKLQIDHVVPLHMGGTDAPENLQLLCMRCNTSKGARYIG